MTRRPFAAEILLSVLWLAIIAVAWAIAAILLALVVV